MYEQQKAGASEYPHVPNLTKIAKIKACSYLGHATPNVFQKLDRNLIFLNQNYNCKNGN